MAWLNTHDNLAVLASVLGLQRRLEVVAIAALQELLRGRGERPGALSVHAGRPPRSGVLPVRSVASAFGTGKRGTASSRAGGCRPPGRASLWRAHRRPRCAWGGSHHEPPPALPCSESARLGPVARAARYATAAATRTPGGVWTASGSPGTQHKHHRPRDEASTRRRRGQQQQQQPLNEQQAARAAGGQPSCWSGRRSSAQRSIVRARQTSG
eukprot:scaffold7506_cov376-Prasinococcus_capsulatus_cf.AAC.2